MAGVIHEKYQNEIWHQFYCIKLKDSHLRYTGSVDFQIVLPDRRRRGDAGQRDKERWVHRHQDDLYMGSCIFAGSRPYLVDNQDQLRIQVFQLQVPLVLSDTGRMGHLCSPMDMCIQDYDRPLGNERWYRTILHKDRDSFERCKLNCWCNQNLWCIPACRQRWDFLWVQVDRRKERCYLLTGTQRWYRKDLGHRRRLDQWDQVWPLPLALENRTRTGFHWILVCKCRLGRDWLHDIRSWDRKRRRKGFRSGYVYSSCPVSNLSWGDIQDGKRWVDHRYNSVGRNTFRHCFQRGIQRSIHKGKARIQVYVLRWVVLQTVKLYKILIHQTNRWKLILLLVIFFQRQGYLNLIGGCVLKEDYFL